MVTPRRDYKVQQQWVVLNPDGHLVEAFDAVLDAVAYANDLQRLTDEPAKRKRED